MWNLSVAITLRWLFPMFVLDERRPRAWKLRLPLRRKRWDGLRYARI